MTTQTENPSRRVEWTNSRGQSVVATLAIQLSEIAYADGHNIEVPCCRWREMVELEGRIAGTPIAIPPRKIGETTVVAMAGRVGIPAEQMVRIDAARAELRATPEWVAHEARIARNRAEAAEYDRRQAAMPGWCPRCQSCCYGDCTA